MKGIKATAILVLGLALILAVALPAIAEDQRSALFKQYWGTIRSIRIDRCGTQPGLCKGAIILAQREGGGDHGDSPRNLDQARGPPGSPR